MGVIKVQKNADDRKMAREQKRLDAAKSATFEAMKELREKRRAAGRCDKQGLVGQIHYDALMNAVEQEGPDVLSSAGRDYFDFEARQNPWMTVDGKAPGTDSINGHRCRLGKVKEKYIGGEWYQWDAKTGDWVKGEATKRRGIR